MAVDAIGLPGGLYGWRPGFPIVHVHGGAGGDAWMHLVGGQPPLAGQEGGVDLEEERAGDLRDLVGVGYRAGAAKIGDAAFGGIGHVAAVVGAVEVLAVPALGNDGG